MDMKAFDEIVDDIQLEKEAGLRLSGVQQKIIDYLSQNPVHLFEHKQDIMRHIAKNWDKPEELAAIYGSHFAKPQEQKEIFEAAGQAKKYKELTEDEAHRKAMIDSFNTLYKYKTPMGTHYDLQSPNFTTPGGQMTYALNYGIPANTTTSVQKVLRGRGYANAIEAKALQDMARTGFLTSTSDPSGQTSTIRQISYEKKMERYPHLVKFNPEYRKDAFSFEPMYNITSNRDLSFNMLYKDNVKNLKLTEIPVAKENKDSVLFLPGKTPKPKEGKPVYDFGEMLTTHGGDWNIRRAYPEGYSGGSLDPAHKEFRADPEFIKKHRSQYKKPEYFQAALKKAEDLQGQK